MEKAVIPNGAGASVGPFVPPKGQHATLIAVSDTGNNAADVIVVDVSADDGATFISVALVDLTSLTFAGIANLTGPNKIGKVVLDGGENMQFRFRRTDATAGTATVWWGITTPNPV